MAREYCSWVSVTDLRSGVVIRYYSEWMCWMVEDGDDTSRPPSPVGGSSGIDDGATRPPVNFIPDPSGAGEVVVAVPGEVTPEVQAGAGFNPGWNSGAHSIESLPASWVGAITFDVPDVRGARPGGVAVGLAPVSELPAPGRNGYKHLRYGIIFTADAVRVIHEGVVVLQVPYATVRAARGVGESTDAVQALMYGHAIKWVVNDLTLFAAAFTMPEDYALDATLYTAYDAVDNPAFTAGLDWGDAEDGSMTVVLAGLAMEADGGTEPALAAELPRLAMRLSELNVSDITAVLPPLRFECGVGEGMAGAIGPLNVLMAEWDDYAVLIGAIGPLSCWIGMGTPDPSVRYSVMAPTLPRLRMTAKGPAYGSMAAALPGFVMRASAETTYAELVAELPRARFTAYSGELTPLVKVIEYVAAGAPALPAAYIAISFIERVDGSATAAAYATVTADASEEITAEDAASAVMTMLDSVIEQLGAGERLVTAMFRIDGDAPADEGPAWVVNTDSRATTRYDAYGFNSFFVLDGKHFGVRQDGVYLLEGTSDAGQPIVAGVALGKHDFGTQALKGLEAVYAGVSSTGKLYLRVSDGKNTYTYAARAASETLEAQRFDVGRGLRANYFTFELVSEGDVFELDSITFNVLASQRRI